MFKHASTLKVGRALDLGDINVTHDGDVVLKASRWASRQAKEYPGVPLVVRCDGGFQGDVGSIGVVLYSTGGEEILRFGKYDVGYTNNQSELLAVRYALDTVVEMGWKYAGDFIRVIVDS